MYSISCRFKILYLLFHSSILYSLLEVSSSIKHCGEQFRTTSLTYNETYALLGDSPWHVAVYDMRRLELICGGTIVSPTLVISAAQCFFNTATREKNEANSYLIVTGKFKRDYYSTDSVVQKAYKLKEIRFSPEKPYSPSSGQHASDIAALVLEEPIQFREWVRPACVDWTSLSPFIPPRNMNFGKVAGWGARRKESPQPSDTLQIASLPFVNYTDCMQKMSVLDYDKFCAGTDDVGAGKGDGGGGLLFKGEDNRYYLRGIVSTRKKFSNSSVSGFTDLTYHIDWLARVNQEISENVPTMSENETTISENEAKSLFQAAMEGQLQQIKHLIQNNSEYVSLKNSFNNTALHLAALYNHTTVLEYLIDIGKADVNTKGYRGQTPVHLAVSAGHLNVVKCLVEKKANINLRDDFDDTVLHMAVHVGHINVLRYLIDKTGANVDTKGYYERTPLHLAVLHDHIDMVKYLLKKKADINLRDGGNNTALHLAVRMGHRNIVECLVKERNIDVNMAALGGLTALHLAAEKGNLNIIRTLIENKADINQRDDKNNAALHYAVMNGRMNVLKYLIEEKRGVVDVKGSNGCTPLHMAAMYGHTDVVKYLIEKKADINLRNDGNDTALHWAARYGYINIVKYLVEKGKADPNTRNVYKMTFLHYAAIQDYRHIIEYFAEKSNIDVNARDVFGRTASDIIRMTREMLPI